jgi:transposase
VVHRERPRRPADRPGHAAADRSRADPWTPLPHRLTSAIPAAGRAARRGPCSWRKERRAWRAGGEAALASKGPGGNACKLDEDQLAQLGAALDAGPAVYGWTDQCWTLARVAALIGRLFGVSYTLRDVSYLLHRLGFPPQAAITAWREQTWVKARG